MKRNDVLVDSGILSSFYCLLALVTELVTDNILQVLVGCFGFNGPLRQYFRLYWAVSQSEGERKEMIDQRKMSIQPPPAPTVSAVGPCPCLIKISRTPWHWKFTQHHRNTRPPLPQVLLAQFLLMSSEQWRVLCE